MKNKYTPFHGQRLKGKVAKTIVRGTLVYSEKIGDAQGKILAEPGFGQFIRRHKTQALENKLLFKHYRAIAGDYFNNVHRKNFNNVIE